MQFAQKLDTADLKVLSVYIIFTLHAKYIICLNKPNQNQYYAHLNQM